MTVKMVLAWALGGALVGCGVGLIPLAVGFYRRVPQKALIAFLVSVAVGAAFGMYGAPFVASLFAVNLWRYGALRYIPDKAR